MLAIQCESKNTFEVFWRHFPQMVGNY